MQSSLILDIRKAFKVHTERVSEILIAANTEL